MRVFFGHGKPMAFDEDFPPRLVSKVIQVLEATHRSFAFALGALSFKVRMPSKAEAIAGVKKVRQRLAELMKGSDPNPIPKELFKETGTMVFRGAKGYNGHAAIAKAFTSYVNIDCVVKTIIAGAKHSKLRLFMLRMNNEKFLVTGCGEYVIALGQIRRHDEEVPL
ncbi:hypothetical protein AAVH_33210 [Aphelenchoides avenae]|nr:hypothetical protein AAVH_33210 [Aphelenchus avenae]